MMLTRLPHRVVIQSEERTEFEGGAYTTSWTTDSTEWANVQLDNSINAVVETYSEDKKQQDTFYKVITRQDVTITNKNRLLFNGNILVVEAEGDHTSQSRMKVVRCRLENT